MDFIKKIKTGLDVLECKFLGKRKPIVVSFEVTSDCLRDCDYCSYEGDKEDFSTDEILSMISEVSEMGTKKVLFTGGEPLLRDDIGKFVRKAKEEGLSVNINTNGDLFSQKIDEIKDADYVVFSLDGPKHIHDELRGHGSFKNVMESIELAKEKGINIGLTTTITRKNYHSIPELLDIVKDIQVPLKIQNVACNDETFGLDENKDIKLSKKEMEGVVSKVIEFKEKNDELINFSYKTLKDIVNLYNESGFDCVAGILACRIEDGKLLPCGRNLSEKSGVEIENGFREAWEKLDNSEKYCNYNCCTGALEEINVWNLDPSTLKDNIFNTPF